MMGMDQNQSRGSSPSHPIDPKEAVKTLNQCLESVMGWMKANKPLHNHDIMEVGWGSTHLLGLCLKFVHSPESRTAPGCTGCCCNQVCIPPAWAGCQLHPFLNKWNLAAVSYPCSGHMFPSQLGYCNEL